jgi:hypothetical protein
LARSAVANQSDVAGGHSGRGEPRGQLLISGLKRDITHVKFLQDGAPSGPSRFFRRAER